MNAKMLVVFGLATALIGSGCGKKVSAGGPDAAPSASAAGAAPPSAAAQPQVAAGGDKCSALGCTGEGTFFEMCDCKTKPQPVPFAAKYSGKYSSFFKQPEWQITNTTDKDLHWGSAAVYYYDKAGKQLEAKINDKPYTASRVNGSNLTLKPNETKTIHIGFKQDSEPKGVASMEIVFDGWCYGKYDDKSTHQCMRIERAPDQRARSGS